MKQKRLLAKRKRVRSEKDRRYDRDRKMDRGLAFPVLTPFGAKDLAMLLMSGVPPEQACSYVAPKFAASVQGDDPSAVRKRAQWVSRWMNEKFLVSAMTKLNGAEWHKLEGEKRLQLAFNKHLAELAFLLYTRNYNDADAPVSKMNSAREALQAHIEGSAGDPDSAWMQWVKGMMDGKADAGMSVLPSVLPAGPAIKES